MIKKAASEDAMTLAELAVQMWDSHTLQELETDFLKIVNSDDAVCFIRFAGNEPVGFAQCGLRNDYVEGTKTSPVGYLEGIFVQKEFRHRGYAKELLKECEKWARSKHCSEFASDCELSNISSLKFHMSMGFDEANRIICFRKDI